MKRLGVLVVVLVLGGAGIAGAAVRPGATEIVPFTDHRNGIVYGTLSLPYQRWVNQARVPTPRTQIEVRENAQGGCPVWHGFACWFAPDRIIFFTPTAPEPHFWFLHELGHAFASDQLPEHALSERFADAYAECALRLQHKMKPRLRRRCEAIRSAY